MKKITTLFTKDPTNLKFVTETPNPENQWVFDGEGIATRKYDGTAAAIIDGRLFKRYDVKKGREVPYGAIPCQEPDSITGHWPHWVLCQRENKEDRYFFEGYDNLPEADRRYGTYELCGPRVNSNRENFSAHTLVPHGADDLIVPSMDYHGIKTYLETRDIEGIVFHHKADDRMCKIRKSDFGLKR